jgi:serine/threonine-protein kinase
VDTRTDVYALGVLLAEMATGRRPHPDNFAASGSTLRAFAPLKELPAGLRRLLLQCTDVDPRRRPADGQAVLDLFARLLPAPGAGPESPKDPS